MLVPTKKKKEIWKRVPIRKYRKYYKVSNEGRVKRTKTFSISCWNGKVFWTKRKEKGLLKQTTQGPYLRVQLNNPSNQGKSYYVHTLVLLTFHGLRPIKNVSRHLNDNPLDNRSSNLRWGTISQNAQDAHKNGKSNQVGERNNCSKLTDKQVEYIRRVCEKTYERGTKARLARKFGVNRGYITELTSPRYRARRQETLPF